MRRDRPGLGLLALIVMVGIGLLAAAYSIWVQGSEISQNQRLIRQQQAVVDQLLGQSAEDRAQTAQLRSLVLALQQQVRDLGGTPLTQAPTPPASPRAADPTPAAAPATPRSRATRSPSPTPRPTGTPRPGVSPAPRPSPSPTRICLGPVCIPPGVLP